MKEDALNVMKEVIELLIVKKIQEKKKKVIEKG